MPRKSKKQRPSTTTSSTLATRRHWIYTTTDTTNNSSSQYDSYLHQRVQRVLVRSVPSNFSYFNDAAVNNAATPVAAASGAIEEDKSAAIVDESNEIQQVPHSTKLTYTQIALPPQQSETSSNSNTNDATSTTNQYSSAYSKFTTLPITKDSRHAKFQFSLNYETHVPSKALISYVGNSSGSGADQSSSSSGYVLQLPVGKGTVIGYSPPLDEGDDIVGEEEEEEEGEFEVERMESDQVLFRVLWDGCTTAASENNDGSTEEKNKKNVVGYTEDLTLDELLPCLITQPPAATAAASKKSSSSSRSRSTPNTTTTNITTVNENQIIIPSKVLTQKALSIHKHVHATTTRKQLSLEEKMENELLPHLVILASLELRKEIAQKIRLELLLERKKRRVEMGLEKKKKNGGGKEEEVIVNEDGMAYQYYMRHPNQYLSSFQPPPSLPSDDEESDLEDLDVVMEGGGDEGQLDAAASAAAPKRSKTKLSKQELVTYNERVQEACNFAPSKLAERVKLACSMAFEYASRKGLLEAYYVEGEQRKERERIEKEKMARDASGVAAKSSAFGLGGIDGTGEVRRSGRARTSVNYYDDGTRDVDDLVAVEARKVGEFVVGSLPGENVSGGPTARYLLDVLGMMPKEEEDVEKKEETDDVSDEESIHEEEEGADPFFEPSHCLIIDQLGRKHRYMSPAQIQSAIVRSIDGEIVETPNCLLDEEQAGDRHHYITDIICTTEDKKSDLPQYEPASFARCRFTPHTIIQEREEDEEDHEEVAAQKQAEREAKAAARARKAERRRVRLAAEQKRNAELERAYRAKKAFELWRFRSIHGDGCTIWPLWSERAQSLLNNLFTMSRVNSVEAMDVSSGADVQGQANPAAEAGLNGGAAATQNDEELARSLAAAADASDGEPLAKRRRTTRRAAGGDEPVFYGGHQSMSRDQLLETLVRILRQAKPGSSSFMDLKRLVFADDYDMSRGGAVELRKLRSALGHLVYRLGKIGRLTVDVESDSKCMELLKEGALVKFVSDEPQIQDGGEAVKSEQGGDVVVSESIPLAPAIDEHLKRQLSALEQYMCDLQHTEFSLRAALMRALDKGGKGGETLMQLSTLAIATAADETEGAADAGDWEFYLPKKADENGESEAGNADIKWNSSNHDFLGKVILRPQTSPLRPQGADVDPNEKCHWYRVVSYAASEKAAEPVGDEKPATNADTDAHPNVIVERRMRFRAVPIAESDIDAPPVESGMDSDDDEISFMILTEAQVKAGMEAASLHRRISAPSNGNTLSSSLQTHPFRNRAGSRVMLTPIDGQFEVIYGIITGFDLSSGNDMKNKVLILLEGGDNESLKESCAFWASVDDEGTLLSDIHPDKQENAPSLCSKYKIDMHEYYPGSEAYSVCESVVTYLRNHAKSGPFMEPVDPIALGIPDYTTVVKNPMDISTLLKNLEEGKYSRIPPKPAHANDDEDEGADHPVYRMAYGPFYEALMLIFDNAILYNGIQTWIGADAALLKKNVIRKIDQAVSKATWYGQAKKSSVASGAKKSIYAEEDSDVDMYEYESDYEDEEGGGRRKARKGKAKRKKKHAKEDIASKAIERPFELPEGVSGFWAGGAFPHLKVQTNVGKFSLPKNWSCRHIQEEEEVKDETGVEETSEEEEMLMLMQMQQEEEHGVRRSSRARNAPKSYADEVTDEPTTTTTTQSAVVIPGVEYYMMDGDIFQPAQSNSATDDFIPTVCRSRLGAEGVQETIHELFFGKLYRDHSPNAMILADGLGTYANGSFPPFLGRVIQTDSNNSVWEIREQYLIPALRWVLRGLVKSGHLAEVDGSLSDGLLDDAAAKSSFGAGIVVPSHEYYYNESFPPFEVLDEKEVLRKRRQEAAADSDSSSDEEVELSEYEKMRAERVARNAERLKLLGLA